MSGIHQKIIGRVLPRRGGAEILLREQSGGIFVTGPDQGVVRQVKRIVIEAAEALGACWEHEIHRGDSLWTIPSGNYRVGIRVTTGLFTGQDT